MSLINGSHFIFVHIYKCGGTSLRKLFYDNLPVTEFGLSHATAKELKKSFYDCQGYFYFHTAYKFTFVRNPFDWVVSLYEFIRGNEAHENYEEIKDMNFEEFCQWNVDAIQSKKQNINGKLNTMTEFLYDDDGNLLVDFVGRLENIEEDINVITKRLNMPKINMPKMNTSKRKPNYSDYYNDESRRIVEEGFAEDLKNFNYQF